jgi:hypothetical protein
MQMESFGVFFEPVVLSIASAAFGRLMEKKNSHVCLF